MSHFKSKLDFMVEEYLVDAGKYYAQKNERRASTSELEDYKKAFSTKVNKYVKEFEEEVSEKLKNKDWDKEFNKLKNKEDMSKDKWIRQARSLCIEKLYSHIWKSLKKSFLSKYNKEPQEKDLIEFPKIAAVYFYRKVLESLRKGSVIKESKREEPKNVASSVITRYGFHDDKRKSVDLLIDHHKRVNNLGKIGAPLFNHDPQKIRPRSLNPFLQIIKQGNDSQKTIAKRLSESGNERENTKTRRISKDL
ncbi:hypothetical protein RclHR1_12400001 [Rhizophagus clarus]|uniref:Uncharacterized protein n=1 Tax=Rhizophagus clarus TaxID=94130 RepID=A0A2Z6Q782_9GLOM|nr:hypothetical protein RclHR1_12400001 [Rhizophagus clarus]GES78975.1 hypothetical protein GLOIN_2v1885665 [Rhizophagus clarus]